MPSKQQSKGDGVEARRLMRVFVEPEANRVLWLHVRVLLVLDQGEGLGPCVPVLRLARGELRSFGTVGKAGVPTAPAFRGEVHAQCVICCFRRHQCW
jgi:hypothetical protein